MHAAPVAHAGGGAVVSHIEITAWVDAQLPPGTGALQKDPA
jgi:hypothetical protein